MPPTLEGFEAVVVGDVCNVRTGPDTKYDWKGEARRGERVLVQGYDNGWYLVKTKSCEGYIAGWLVDVDLSSRGVSARITKSDVNVREGPDLSFEVKFMVGPGTVLPAEARRGDWIRVTLGDGADGWIREDLLVLEYRVIESEPATGLMVFPAGQSLSVTHSAMVSSEVLATLSRGESARLVGCRGAYIAVVTSKGVGGWVYGPQATVISSNDGALSFGVSASSWSLGRYSTFKVNATDVNFRSGPGTSYPAIGMLQKGDTLRLIETQGDWIRAVSPKGVTGWVASWLTTGASDAKGFTVTADASGKARTVTVTGDFQSAVILPGPDGTSVTISTSVLLGTDVLLPVNAFEFESLRVSGSDVTVNLLGRSSYSVKTNVRGKVVVEFAPEITGITMTPKQDGDYLTVDTLGFAWPDVTRNGNNIDLFVAGASFTGSATNQPGGSARLAAVGAKDGGTNVSVTAPTNTAYVLTRDSNALTAKFQKPGLAGKTIVVDPGHEADDPGAVGPTGLAERNVNWEIALRLAELLRQQGANVIVTRNGTFESSPAPEDWVPGLDEYSGSLARRVAWSKGADLFVSIHNDSAYDRSAGGTASYVCDRTLNCAESRRLANLIQSSLCPILGTKNRGINDSNLFVVRESSCPAVLVEVMFISNYTEESYLRKANTWELAASGICNAIESFFSPAGSAGI